MKLKITVAHCNWCSEKSAYFYTSIFENLGKISNLMKIDERKKWRYTSLIDIYSYPVFIVNFLVLSFIIVVAHTVFLTSNGWFDFPWNRIYTVRWLSWFNWTANRNYTRKKNKQKHLNVDSSNNGSVFIECLWINKLFFFFSISFRSYSSFMHTKSRPPFQFLLNNVIQCKRLKLMLHTKSHHPNERISEQKKNNSFARTQINVFT